MILDKRRAQERARIDAASLGDGRCARPQPCRCAASNRCTSPSIVPALVSHARIIAISSMMTGSNEGRPCRALAAWIRAASSPGRNVWNSTAFDKAASNRSPRSLSRIIRFSRSETHGCRAMPVSRAVPATRMRQQAAPRARVLEMLSSGKSREGGQRARGLKRQPASRVDVRTPSIICAHTCAGILTPGACCAFPALSRMPRRHLLWRISLD